MDGPLENTVERSADTAPFSTLIGNRRTNWIYFWYFGPSWTHFCIVLYFIDKHSTLQIYIILNILWSFPCLLICTNLMLVLLVLVNIIVLIFLYLISKIYIIKLSPLIYARFFRLLCLFIRYLHTYIIYVYQLYETS